MVAARIAHVQPPTILRGKGAHFRERGRFFLIGAHVQALHAVAFGVGKILGRGTVEPLFARGLRLRPAEVLLPDKVRQTDHGDP